MILSPTDRACRPISEVRLSLGPAEAHLHVLRTAPFSALGDDALHARFGRLLSADEQARYERFLGSAARRQYLLTRALVRTSLSRYVAIDPPSWRFGINPQGRPFIDEACGAGALGFNLSNTDGMIVCLIARTGEVGVDVERKGRRIATTSIARRFFSPVEAAALADVPLAAQSDRFLTFWTLKEAYIKARGIGMAIPLDGFSFRLEAGEITIDIGRGIADSPVGWNFLTPCLSADHVCATALRFDGGADATLVLVDAQPPLSAGIDGGDQAVAAGTEPGQQGDSADRQE